MLMITLAFIFNFLALLANFASYVTPWMYVGRGLWGLGKEANVGLWARCTDNGASCNWWFNNDFDYIKNLPDWEKAVIALFGIAIIFHLVAFIMALAHLTCCRHRISYTSTVAGFLLLVFILVGISIIMYGVYKHKEGVEFKTSGTHFHAAFYLGIVSAAMTLFASLLYACWSGRHD